MTLHLVQWAILLCVRRWPWRSWWPRLVFGVTAA